MKILIAGASGFIGQHLVPFLTKNHDITILGRSIAKLKRCFPQQKAINWNDLKSEPVADYQLVINLCGESIANKRWTKQQKIKILQSRIETTTTLCRWALTSQKPQSLRFLNASAVGIYGLNTKHNTEDTPINKQPRCFSQHIVNTWEATVKKNLDSHLSYTLMRFGVVLKKQCGMLQKLELPYKLGMASTLGDGKQLISWVHIDDLIHAISFIIDHPQLSGPVNIVSPETPTQKQFATILTKALHRPYFLKTPAFFIKLLFGQMGEELLLSGQEVTSKRLKEAGFIFQYQTLTKAIFHEYRQTVC